MPGLSLASVRQQLRLAEMAQYLGDDHEVYEDAAGGDSPRRDLTNMPVMRSLQSPTTRALVDVIEQRATINNINRGIEHALRVQESMQGLMNECEELKATSLLDTFKGQLHGHMTRTQEERAAAIGALPERKLIFAGKESLQRAGAEFSVDADGALTITNNRTNKTTCDVKPLSDGEMPRVLRAEDDETANSIIEKVVFTLARDSAGGVLEVLPSAIMSTSPESTMMGRQQQLARAAEALASAMGTGELPLADVLIDPLMKAIKAERLERQAGGEHPSSSRRESRPRSSSGRPKSGALYIRNKHSSIKGTLQEALEEGESASPKLGRESLQEMLRQQDQMLEAGRAADATYRTTMSRYLAWEHRRIEMLHSLTELDPPAPRDK